MSKKTLFSLFVIVAIGMLSIWAYFVSENLTKDVQQISEKTIDGDKLSVDELILTETKDGEKFWEVYAKKGNYVSSLNVAKLKGVSGNFYKNNKVVMSFEAPAAKYIDKNKQIKLIGGAKAITDSGILITADELCWAGKTDQIVAEKHVKIQKAPKYLLSGDKTVFSSDLKYFKMVGSSQTKVY